MFSIKTIVLSCVFSLLLFLFNQDLFANYGRNEIGIKVGYFSPKDYEPYFPLQSELTEEYVRYDQAVIYLFYIRTINSTLNAGLDIGFSGIVDEKDNNTIHQLYPIDLYLAQKVITYSGFGGYLGAGFSCWLVDRQEEMQAVNGAFVKLEVVYQVLRVEITYSQIDHFGANRYDMGGWGVKAGVSYQFSYY
jgi:hypothetical protein